MGTKENVVYLTKRNKFVKPDFIYALDDYYIIIEVDENQHKRKDYSPEEDRLRELFVYGVLNKPCVFIRYNPDAFKIKGKTKRTNKSIRHKKLLEKINY